MQAAHEEQARQQGGRTVDRLVFLLGLLVFAGLQGALVVYPAWFQPRFPVDTSGYIAKAEQLRSCPLQDCPALVDLRQQVRPTGDPEVDWERNRAYHRGLYVYHPLHSAILLGLRVVLPSWEAAWFALTTVGEILLVGAIAGFVYMAWGPLVGGAALLILAPTLFSGYHGLHTLVPSNLSLAIGFLTWALILTQRRWIPGVLPTAVAAMVAMHAVGQLYAGITILLYLALMDRRAVTPWVGFAAAAAVLIVYLALPHLVERPTLEHWQHPPPADWSFWPALWESLAEAGTIVGEWAVRFGWTGAAILLVAIGLLTAPRPRCEERLMLGAVLALVAFASAFYVLPRYPAELFSRAWIPLAIFANGAIACAWLTWLRSGSSLYADWRSGEPGAKQRFGPLFQDAGRPAVGFCAVGMLVLVGLALNGVLIASFLPTLLDYVRGFKERRLPLEVAQPPLVLGELGTGQSIVFMDELPMYFYFSHGALRRPAVYYPGIENSADEPDWLDAEVGAVVAMRTAERYKKDSHLAFGLPSFSAGLPVEGGAVIRLLGPDGVTWRDGRLRVANRGEETVLQVKAVFDDGQESATWTLSIPGFSERWLPLAVPGGSDARALELRATDDHRLLVTGIRSNGQGDLNWPWDEGIRVDYVYSREQLARAEEGEAGRALRATTDPGAIEPGADAGEPELPSSETILFESQALIPERCRSERVLADGGATVAVAVRCRDA